MMVGSLRSKGFTVQRDRVAGSLRRVDPIGSSNRKKHALKRRVYFAPGPNAVWHMDGNHKLIRYIYLLFVHL